jgi:hypothetical protein
MAMCERSHALKHIVAGDEVMKQGCGGVTYGQDR